MSSSFTEMGGRGARRQNIPRLLQTLEADGTLLSHEWERGDALVFLSHKYHCVSQLTRGTRQVVVCELWQGTENYQPSRDEKERWHGEWKDGGWRVV